MTIQIAVPAAQIAEFCQRNQIRKLSFFGSVLRDNFRPDSDVDVLVEFEPSAHVNYFMLINMQDELTTLFKREVDLYTPESLKPHFRPKVLQIAEVIYEQARQYATA